MLYRGEAVVDYLILDVQAALFVEAAAVLILGHLHIGLLTLDIGTLLLLHLLQAFVVETCYGACEPCLWQEIEEIGGQSGQDKQGYDGCERPTGRQLRTFELLTVGFERFIAVYELIETRIYLITTAIKGPVVHGKRGHSLLVAHAEHERIVERVAPLTYQRQGFFGKVKGLGMAALEVAEVQGVGQGIGFGRERENAFRICRLRFCCRTDRLSGMTKLRRPDLSGRNGKGQSQ